MGRITLEPTLGAEASLAGAPADARLLLDASSSPGVLGRAEFVSCPA